MDKADEYTRGTFSAGKFRKIIQDDDKTCVMKVSGIGVSICPQTKRVTRIIPSSPAFHAMIRGGDQIVNYTELLGESDIITLTLANKKGRRRQVTVIRKTYTATWNKETGIITYKY